MDTQIDLFPFALDSFRFDETVEKKFGVCQMNIVSFEFGVNGNSGNELKEVKVGKKWIESEVKCLELWFDEGNGEGVIENMEMEFYDWNQFVEWYKGVCEEMIVLIKVDDDVIDLWDEFVNYGVMFENVSIEDVDGNWNYGMSCYVGFDREYCYLGGVE